MYMQVATTKKKPINYRYINPRGRREHKTHYSTTAETQADIRCHTTLSDTKYYYHRPALLEKTIMSTRLQVEGTTDGEKLPKSYRIITDSVRGTSKSYIILLITISYNKGITINTTIDNIVI